MLGIDSRGLFDDIKDVVKLAKDMGFDESESFFRYNEFLILLVFKDTLHYLIQEVALE